MARAFGCAALGSRCMVGCTIIFALLLLSSGSDAHQPGDEFADRFQSLKVPGAETVLNPADASYCSPERNCQITDYDTDADGLYWIKAGGEHIQVPPDKGPETYR